MCRVDRDTVTEERLGCFTKSYFIGSVFSIVAVLMGNVFT